MSARVVLHRASDTFTLQRHGQAAPDLRYPLFFGGDNPKRCLVAPARVPAQPRRFSVNRARVHLANRISVDARTLRGQLPHYKSL